jgi:hypothetical protein
MSINVEVHDLAIPQWKSPAEVYRPKLTRFHNPNATGHQGIHHVDIVTTWKGLSVSQAEELLFWKDAFKAALDSIVEEALIAKLTKSGIELDLDRGDNLKLPY